MKPTKQREKEWEKEFDKKFPYGGMIIEDDGSRYTFDDIKAFIRSLLSHQRQEIEGEKNQAYWERNQLVAALSKVFPSHLCRHPDEDKEWENDWRWIVCIHIPVLHRGPSIAVANPDWIEETQVTWHIHDSEKPLFDHLEIKDNHWDGHSSETKYQRLSGLKQKEEK